MRLSGCGGTLVAVTDENELPPNVHPDLPHWAPVCPECRKGAMLPEKYAVAAQTPDPSRVAVVVNVPRTRCGVCGHKEIGTVAGVKAGSLLAASLARSEVAVVDYDEHEVPPDVTPVDIER